MKLHQLTTPFAAYIGIDWADRKHDIALYDPKNQTWSHSVIQATPSAIADWVNQLRQQYGQEKVLVGLEQKRGPLLYALCQYDNLVLVPINPRTVANYRKAFQPSRAKSDPIDAKLIVELLQRHSDKLDIWQAGCPKHRELRQWVESRRMLVGEKVRLTNRITAALKSYYPQVLDWFDDKHTIAFCEFLEQFPNLESAQAATAEELKQFFRSHHIIRKTTIQRRTQQIQEAGPPLTQDPAIIQPAQALVQGLVALLKVILRQLIEFETQIEKLFVSLPDATLFQALPGAGPHLAPRLLAAFGEDRSRFNSAQSFMSYIGIAPVKEESGKKHWVHWQASPEGGFPSVGNWRGGLVRFSCDKPLSNGWIMPDRIRLGHRLFTNSNAKQANPIKRRFGPWPINGVGFCGVVGKIKRPMTRKSMWRH
jgi:transposase